MYASIAGETFPLTRSRLRINAENVEWILGALPKYRQRLSHGRLLILGDSRAGKTSTLNSLVGLTYNPDEDRTHGIETRLVDVNNSSENRWETITGSELGKAETIEAKLVAEGAVNFRKQLESVSKTTHGLYRSGFNLFFKALEPCIGSSTLGKVLAFYFVVLAIVGLLGLAKTAFLDLCVFVCLELIKESRSRRFDYCFWLFILHGIHAGINLGNCLLLMITNSRLQVLFENCLNSEMQCAIILLFMVELVTAFKIVIKGKSYLRNFIDTFDIPPNWGIVIHAVMLGGAFGVSLPSMTNNTTFSVVICTAILVLRIFYSLKMGLLCDFAVSIGIVFESINVIYGLCHSTTSLSPLSVTDLAIHCYTSWRYQNKVLGVRKASFVNAVFNSPKLIFAASELLTNQEKLEREIAAIQKMKMQFVDFAGDEEYYHYHHLFLTDEAMYAIAFNAELLLGQSLTEVKIKHQIKRIYFWLESVCIHAASQCPVLLIATHCGRVSGDALKRLDGLLRGELWDTFCHKIVLNYDENFIFAPVENSNGPADAGICRLRQTILHVAESECSTLFHKEVPLSWIKLEDEILERRNSTRNESLCIRINDFESIAETCEVDKSKIKIVLDYLYHKGIVLFVQNNGKPTWILLQPRLLVDVVIDLVSMPSAVRQERTLRKDWRFLYEQGMLTSNLLAQILSRFNEDDNAMKALLEEHNLICSIKVPQLQCQSNLYRIEDAAVTHFVPVLLPKSTPDDSVWISKPSDRRFYVFFHGFFPEAVFHNLLSRAYKLNRLSCPNGSPEVRRDDAMFWLSPHQCYRLTMLKNEGLIEVTVSR